MNAFTSIRITILPVLLIGLLAISCEGSFADNSSNAASGGKGGSLARFAITGDNLYAVTLAELKHFDITDPEQPDFSSNINLNFGVETIFPMENHLFIGTRTGMLIYDISTPTAPKYLSSYSHVYSCDPVVVQGNYAYVTLNSENTFCGRNNNRLDIIDISNLSEPVNVAEYGMESPKGLGVDNDLLFLCDDGLKLYDISNKENITLLQQLSIKATDVIPNDSILIVTGSEGIYQYDYSSGSLDLLSKISLTK